MYVFADWTKLLYKARTVTNIFHVFHPIISIAQADTKYLSNNNFHITTCNIMKMFTETLCAKPFCFDNYHFRMISKPSLCLFHPHYWEKSVGLVSYFPITLT